MYVSKYIVWTCIVRLTVAKLTKTELMPLMPVKQRPPDHGLTDWIKPCWDFVWVTSTIWCHYSKENVNHFRHSCLTVQEQCQWSLSQFDGRSINKRCCIQGDFQSSSLPKKPETTGVKFGHSCVQAHPSNKSNRMANPWVLRCSIFTRTHTDQCMII